MLARRGDRPRIEHLRRGRRVEEEVVEALSPAFVAAEAAAIFHR